MPSLKAGQLRDRLTLQARADTVDPATGVATIAYATVAPLWGRLVHTGEAPLADFDLLQPRRTYQVTIRPRTDLTLRHRFLAGGRPLYVTGFADVAEARDQQVLQLVEGLDFSAGERATIYRPADVTLRDRSSSRVWIPVTSTARVLLEEVGAERIRTLFGSDAKGEVRAWCAVDLDLREDDAIEITSGAHAGQRFYARRRRTLGEVPAAARRELALEATSESFAKYGQASLRGGGGRVRGAAAGRGALRGSGGKIAATGDNGILFKFDVDDPLWSDPAARGLSIVAPANRYAFDANGIAQPYAANTFRKDAYMRTTLGLWVKSWLIETLGCTNLIASSCDCTNATFWGGFSDFTVTDAPSCIAGQTAKRLTNKGLIVSRSVVQNIGTFTAGVVDVAWVIVENVDADETVFGIRDTSTPTWIGLVRFGWATKTMTLTAGAASYGAIELPNGRWLLWLAGTGVTTGLNRAVILYPSGTTLNTKAAIVHHVQCEPGRSRPSSIIVTTTSSLSRAGETITGNWNTPLQPMTMYARAIAAGDFIGAASPRLIQLDWGSNSAPRVLLYGTSSLSLFGLDSGGSLKTSQVAASPVYGQDFEQRGYFDANGVATSAVTIDGGGETVGPSSGATTLDLVPPLTRLTVGISGGMFAARRLLIARGADKSRAFCRSA